jgi:hypothetical protein
MGSDKSIFFQMASRDFFTALVLSSSESRSIAENDKKSRHEMPLTRAVFSLPAQSVYLKK